MKTKEELISFLEDGYLDQLKILIELQKQFKGKLFQQG